MSDEYDRDLALLNKWLPHYQKRLVTFYVLFGMTACMPIAAAMGDIVGASGLLAAVCVGIGLLAFQKHEMRNEMRSTGFGKLAK